MRNMLVLIIYILDCKELPFEPAAVERIDLGL